MTETVALNPPLYSNWRVSSIISFFFYSLPLYQCYEYSPWIFSPSNRDTAGSFYRHGAPISPVLSFERFACVYFHAGPETAGKTAAVERCRVNYSDCGGNTDSDPA